MRLDAHQHFWRYDPVEYGWIGPEMAALQRDFLPADFAPLLRAAGIDGSIAVQARQCLAETEWLLDLARDHSCIKGVVGWVDLCSPDLAGQLARFAPQRKLRGVRHVVQDEPDDRFMLRPDFMRGLSSLAAFNLTYDILVYPRHLPIARELVERFPEQRFVLDHIAKPLIRDRVTAPWEADIRRLAAHPNVYCKVSGLVTEAGSDGWLAADFQPYLDIIFEAFGVSRVMFGSDWPVCTMAASYREVITIVADFVSRFSPAEQGAVLGDNAARFYQIGEL